MIFSLFLPDVVIRLSAKHEPFQMSFLLSYHEMVQLQKISDNKAGRQSNFDSIRMHIYPNDSTEKILFLTLGKKYAKKSIDCTRK